MAGKHLPLGLCRETVKESSLVPQQCHLLWLASAAVTVSQTTVPRCNRSLDNWGFDKWYKVSGITAHCIGHQQYRLVINEYCLTVFILHRIWVLHCFWACKLSAPQDMSPWWPLLGLLSWCRAFKWSLCDSSEEYRSQYKDVVLPVWGPPCWR